MKKLLLSILAILLCLSAFTLIACNGDDNTTTDDITTTDNVTTTNGDNVTTLPSYEYNITYELNGGINNAENPTGYNSEDIITLNTPTREGYFFAGWYTEQAFENRITEIKNRAENITLYAKWVPSVTYKVNYQLNGGTNNISNPSRYKTGDVIELGFPTKEDYMFAGWYTDSALKNEIKEINNNEENITLYAKWIPYEDMFEFSKEEEGYSLSIAPKHAVKTIIIPSSYNGFPVEEIVEASRGEWETVEAVYVPKTVKLMANRAFDPIGLNQRTSLKQIEIEEGNESYKSIDGVWFSKDGKTLILYPFNKTGTSYTVPNGVNVIAGSAFRECANLEEIIIPDSVTHIGGYAFYKCVALKTIVIPDSVIEILYNAFQGCTSLESVSLSKNIDIIHLELFAQCTSLKNIIIPNGVKEIKLFAFDGCSSLERVVIPASVETIKSTAFRSCSLLTVYCEPDSMPEGWEGDYLFYDAKEVIWGYKES